MFFGFVLPAQATFLVSDAFEYTNGGAVTSVKVYEWMNGALVDKGTIGAAATTTPGVYCNTASVGIPATGAAKGCIPSS